MLVTLEGMTISDKESQLENDIVMILRATFENIYSIKDETQTSFWPCVWFQVPCRFCVHTLKGSWNRKE